MSTRVRGTGPKSSSTLYGGAFLVNTALPSSEKTTWCGAPVTWASKRTGPVCIPASGSDRRVTVGRLEDSAALASARRRARSISPAVLDSAGATRSSAGTFTSRSTRNAFPELTSSTLTISVYVPGRSGRWKIRGSASPVSGRS